MGSTVPLWVAVVFGLSSPVVAIVALVAAEIRDRRRLQHERDMKEAEIEAGRDDRVRDERIAAYRKFLSATSRARMDREGVQALAEDYAEISLLAGSDELDRAAARVWVDCGQAQKIARRMQEEKGEAVDRTSEFAQALTKVGNARDHFLKLAREELGVEGRSAGFTDLEESTSSDALSDPEGRS